RNERHPVLAFNPTLITKDEIISTASVDGIPTAATEQNIIQVAPGNRVIAAVRILETDGLDGADGKLMHRKHGVQIVGFVCGNFGIITEGNVRALACVDDVIAGATDDDIVAISSRDVVCAAK